MIRNNILLLSDSYKISHYRQYPPGTSSIYSYFESRGGRFNEVVFFGLQYLIQNYLEGAVVTKEKIEEAATLYSGHFGSSLFYREGWEYILHQHQGRLPVRIKAAPEGAVIPTHNVMMTIENTDPACYWLTNFLETLLVQAWYGCTVATQSREIKKVILRYLEETGDPAGIDFKLHDFGFRGVSSVESASIGGAAHLINFMGTDTVAGLSFIQDHYHTQGVYGFSIPAAEHSTITSWGRENEAKAYANMLDQFKEGLVAVVSDSYDVYNACENIWGKTLKDKILQRNGTLVVRPDSGIPKEVVLKVIELLGQQLGYSTNAKGYKVLVPQVRVIQGDGVDYDAIGDILENLKNHGWSADTIAFGMGGALLQKLDRDTQKFAFKCSAAVVQGESRDVYKDPITDKGKRSKRGRLKLIQTETGYQTVAESDLGKDELVAVFENGKMLKQYSFEEVKKNAAIRS
ncbi:MAG: nicotinate phosphoribosyltransferase [Cytophagaceae bacterium]|jgi:nicotinamide phosphoribosyltransferase|nr:nicotinate phosphoribosyltransferase [Cytophagaceae bacterium]